MKEMLNSGLFQEKEKERAAKILDALDGLNIVNARSLLEKCSDSLMLLTIGYKTECGETTS